jgi:hypothetical protein
MFTASYPASFLPEEDGRGFHVRFPICLKRLRGETTSRIRLCKRRIVWRRRLRDASLAAMLFRGLRKQSAGSI